MSKINALIVAGGAGGSTFQTYSSYKYGGGGGGAGGLLNPLNINIILGNNNIIVGAGGTANANGGDSSFLGYIAKGGGTGGIGSNNFGQASSGYAGGSGGGAEGNSRGSPAVGGLGVSGQGNNGGGAYTGTTGGGGGGGANGVGAYGTGQNINNYVGGNGGAGKTVTIGGTSITYAGGGGGGADEYLIATYGGSQGVGGVGGGGNAKISGVNGLGGGGGGGGSGSFPTPGNGGSGIVKVYFLIDGSDGISTSSTGGTITKSGLYQIHTFTTNGIFNAIASVVPPVISTIPDIHFTNNELSSYDLSQHASATVFPITGYGLTGTPPTGISFDNVTGIISGTSAATGTYPLVFEATNQSGTTAKTFNLIINSPTAPVMGVIADIVINSWDNINKDFSLDVTQTNQDPILSYTLTGTLILGLNFNTTTGILSGNPTQVGTYGFGIQATDKDGISNTSNFNIIINKSKEIIKESGFFDLITNTT